jgi:pimeloyl-[acyl-carrier protein] synthase
MNGAERLLTNDAESLLMSDEFYVNPHKFYDRIREQGKPYWSPKLNAWLVTNYKDIQTGLKGRDFEASRRETYFGMLPADERAEMEPLKKWFDLWLLFSDDPFHEKVKNLVIDSFTPRYVKKLAGTIENFAEAEVQKMSGRTQIDFVQDYAVPLSVSTIAHVLGVPVRDYEDVLRWTHEIIGFMGTGRPNINKGREAMKALGELNQYLAKVFNEKRNNPKDDLISNLLVNQAKNNVTDEEMSALIANILIDGHEPTSFTMASGMFALLSNPEQKSLLSSDINKYMPGFIEETLRYDPIFTYSGRRSEHEIDFEGAHINKDQRVLFVVAAGNRDPKVFDDPHAFKIDRSPNRHLTFGYGSHYCLGASLARSTMEIGFKRFLTEYPNAATSVKEPNWRKSVGFRAFDNLKVELHK